MSLNMQSCVCQTARAWFVHSTECHNFKTVCITTNTTAFVCHDESASLTCAFLILRSALLLFGPFSSTSISDFIPGQEMQGASIQWTPKHTTLNSLNNLHQTLASPSTVISLCIHVCRSRMPACMFPFHVICDSDNLAKFRVTNLPPSVASRQCHTPLASCQLFPDTNPAASQTPNHALFT